MAIEGLNIVPDDLVVASLLGRTARDVTDPGRADPGERAATEALGRIIARLAADGATGADDARARLSAAFEAAGQALSAAGL